MQETSPFSQLLLVIFLAFLVPLVLRRFKNLQLPIVVGEIIAGILIGHSGFAIVTGEDEVLQLLSEFGFVFLMFLSGMEIDLGSLRINASGGKGVNPVRLGAQHFGLTVLLALAAGFGLTAAGLVQNPWMMGLILSTTSLGVVLPVIKERGYTRGRYGQSILVAALIADFATMVLITVFVSTYLNGLSLDILLIGVLMLAFIVFYRSGLLFFNRIPGARRVVEELSHATAQIKIRAAFTLMLVFVALSDFLGTEVILGAFLAGVIVALLRQPEDADLGHQLEAIGFGFFIPIFFIMVGVQFDMNALVAEEGALILLPLLLALAFLIKLLPSLLFVRPFGRRQALSAGFLLSSRLSLIIAASAIGLRLELITSAVNSAIILVAIITVTFAPILFSRLAPPPEKRDERLTIIVGANSFGIQIARQLSGHKEPVLLIDEDAAGITLALEYGLNAHLTKLTEPDEFSEALLRTASNLVCAIEEPERRERVCRVARQRFGVTRVLAVVTDPTEAERYRAMGVTALSPNLDWAAFIALLVRFPSTFDLLTRVDDDKDVMEIEIHRDDLDGRLLRDLPLPGDVRLLAIRRAGEVILPTGYTRLALGDNLSLAGSLDYLDSARDLLS